MMPASALGKKKPAESSMISIKHNKPKVTSEQSMNIMNNLFDQLDKKGTDELEDINSSAILAEMNKPIAFNKQDQLHDRYNVSLDAQTLQRVQPVVHQVNAGQTHNTVNQFSKKRTYD